MISKVFCLLTKNTIRAFLLHFHSDFSSTEPFLDVDFEYRIQKIGSHISCFRRSSEGSWKANMPTEEGDGDLDFQPYECTELHTLWIEECAKVCWLETFNSQTRCLEAWIFVGWTSYP